MSKRRAEFLQPFAKFFRRILRRIRRDKKVFIPFLIFEGICLAVFLRNALEDRVDCCVIAALAMVLLFVPSVVETSFHLRLPVTLEIIVFFFVFCAEILGEIDDYYQMIPLLDTVLHTVSGFMFAAFGFCVVDIFNQSGKFKAELSPFFLAFVAFCFSITIGTLWEFFEWGGDSVFGLDMQKDFIIPAIHSVTISGPGDPETVAITGIAKTVLYDADGNILRTIEGGYLDIGLNDTMKDMLVNFIGAVIFSIIGYVFIKQRDNTENRHVRNVKKVAEKMIPEYVGGYGKFVAEADAVPGDDEAFVEEQEPLEKGVRRRKKRKNGTVSPIDALLSDNPASAEETEGELDNDKKKHKKLFALNKFNEEEDDAEWSPNADLLADDPDRPKVKLSYAEESEAIVPTETILEPAEPTESTEETDSAESPAEKPSSAPTPAPKGKGKKAKHKNK